jgi:hypothetical protein
MELQREKEDLLRIEREITLLNQREKEEKTKET